MCIISHRAAVNEVEKECRPARCIPVTPFKSVLHVSRHHGQVTVSPFPQAKPSIFVVSVFSTAQVNDRRRKGAVNGCQES